MSWVSTITNQSQYIDMLKVHLARLPEAERADIVRDQEEFFREALLSGRTEADVIGSLGDPKQLAKSLIAESRVAASEDAFRQIDAAKNEGGKSPSLPTQMNATLRAFLAIVTLAPFNLIFVLGPFLFVMGCLFAGWACGTASLLGGLAVVFFFIAELTGIGASPWAGVSTMSLGLSVVLFSTAFLGVMTLISSWIARLSVRYLRWNLDLISQRSGKT